jgi:hypothetical protein
MKMIGHQAIGVKAKLKKIQILGKIFQKLALVSGIEKGTVSRICSGKHVIKAKTQTDAFRPRHNKIFLIKMNLQVNENRAPG